MAQIVISAARKPTEAQVKKAAAVLTKAERAEKREKDAIRRDLESQRKVLSKELADAAKVRNRAIESAKSDLAKATKAAEADFQKVEKRVEAEKNKILKLAQRSKVELEPEAEKRMPPKGDKSDVPSRSRTTDSQRVRDDLKSQIRKLNSQIKQTPVAASKALRNKRITLQNKLYALETKSESSASPSASILHDWAKI